MGSGWLYSHTFLEFVGVEGGEVNLFLRLQADHPLQVVEVGVSLYIQFGAIPEAELAPVVDEDKPNCFAKTMWFVLGDWYLGWSSSSGCHEGSRQQRQRGSTTGETTQCFITRSRQPCGAAVTSKLQRMRECFHYWAPQELSIGRMLWKSTEPSQ